MPTQTLSGRYFGPMTAPTAGKKNLELRVDVSPRYPESPVLNRLSGDIYEVSTVPGAPGGEPLQWGSNNESWNVDAVTKTEIDAAVRLTGTFRGDAARAIEVNIPQSGDQFGPAEVRITDSVGVEVYRCTWQSRDFREIECEIDYCKSIQSPALPVYNTHALTDRPSSLSNRDLSIVECFRDSGIGLVVRDQGPRFDDTAFQYKTWSSAELHNVMLDNFERYDKKPQWKLWGLLAGEHDDSDTLGIMFDAAPWSLPGTPQRQGFAVFRKHPALKNLADANASAQQQAEAARLYLFAWIHEIGHACSLMHSDEKFRPAALSWMNATKSHNPIHGSGSFWSEFPFCFDEKELIHLRHGKRSSVIMGGTDFHSETHLSVGSHSLADFGVVAGHPPLELTIRSADRFEFLEPVVVELRLCNLRPDLKLTVDPHLHPETGAVSIYIQDPSGRVQRYEPIMHRLCERKGRQLAVKREKTVVNGKRVKSGRDRLSELISISFGKNGFYFDRPGRYLVRAVYHGLNGTSIPSAVHRITIGFPTTPAHEKLAADFFSREVGLQLYYGGAQSSHWEKARDLLHELVNQFPRSQCGVQSASLLANAYSRPFRRLKRSAKSRKFYEEPDDVKQGLQISHDAAVQLGRGKSRRDKLKNLSFRHLMERRIACLKKLRKYKLASEEKQQMIEILARRGVNPAVIDELRQRRAK